MKQRYLFLIIMITFPERLAEQENLHLKGKAITAILKLINKV